MDAKNTILNMNIFASSNGPFFILLIGIIAVASMIYKFKIHPFIALILSAILVGIITPDLVMDGSSNHLLSAVELPMKEFGIMAGKITWVIALAAIIGAAMMESGAASRIVEKMVSYFGESKAAIALLVSGFVLSIPVFFDTVFFLLIPLAIALAQKTGKNYVLYVVAIAGGAIITHGLVPPTPGPLIVAETLGIDLGVAIIAGIGFAIMPAIFTLWLARKLNDRLDIPVRVEMGSIGKPENSPSFFMSVLPVIVPILLISSVSIVNVLQGSCPESLAFLGNKNIAMTFGALIAIFLWVRSSKLSHQELWQKAAKPLEIAGIIILITSAGGAFGAMIKHSGIGLAIEHATSGMSISFLILGWLIAAVMKTAQGSSTVAMITASSILFAMVGNGSDLPYHPIYLLLSIGFGAGCISWMNDSGFWVVSRMSGFTEKETFQTWSLMFGMIGVIGLVEVMVFSKLFPLI